MNHYFDDIEDEFDEEEEPEASEPSTGWQPREIMILGGLILGIIIVGVIFAVLFFSNANKPVPQVATFAPPTYTIQPTEVPTPTSTPKPTLTPMVGWNSFSFDQDKAEIRLPESYQGGDTIEYFDIVMLTLETYVDDAIYINWVKNRINENEIVFYGFDTQNQAKVLTIDVFIFKEKISPDLILTMDEYLNFVMENLSAGGNRVVDRQIVQLHHYEAGRLFVDVEFEVGTDLTVRGRQAIYSIWQDDVMWSILFRTSKEDFKDYQQVIEDSVNTFLIQP
jgi:hypothetical protein